MLSVESLYKVLANCWDFATERTAFQDYMFSRGQLAEMSPKCHPELAGVGIEYAWGKSKMHFRRHTDHVARHLHSNIEKSMSLEVLPLLRIRRFARKARSYREAYSGSLVAMSRTDIEKQVSSRKRHRSSMDIDWKFIKDT
jgi:hypothetical protein